MGLFDSVRRHCARVAADARFVSIDLEALERLEPGPAPGLDPELHPLELPAEERARWVLISDAINFGSGWFPTLRKREGRSGSLSITLALTEHVRACGVWTPEELGSLQVGGVAEVLGQNPGHELMALYARALNDLGRWLGDRAALDVIPRTAEALAADLAVAMPLFRDSGFYKRAQIVPSDLSLAGIAAFPDLGATTIFADNLVPHVLRIDGVLRYDPALTARIDSGGLLPPGSREEIEIRACGLHACELLSARLGVPARELDGWLWNRGQAPRYKAVPRHRTRTVYY